MDDCAPRLWERLLWREGGARRVTVGSTMAAVGGASYACFRHMPPTFVMRASAACALISCPFFALRETVAAGLAVDGPVASAIAGGVAGYVGALAFSSATWKAVSHGAMIVGMGAGLADVITSGLDFRVKSLLLSRQNDDRLKPHSVANGHSIVTKVHKGNGGGNGTKVVSSVDGVGKGGEAGSETGCTNSCESLDNTSEEGNKASMSSHSNASHKSQKSSAGGTTMPDHSEVGDTVERADSHAVSSLGHVPPSAKSNGRNHLNHHLNHHHHHHHHRDQSSHGDLPVWLPSSHGAEKEEYEYLLQSQKATAAALQQEQDRIARLLATIERLKAGRHDDSQLAERRSPLIDSSQTTIITADEASCRHPSATSTSSTTTTTTTATKVP